MGLPGVANMRAWVRPWPFIRPLGPATCRRAFRAMSAAIHVHYHIDLKGETAPEPERGAVASGGLTFQGAFFRGGEMKLGWRSAVVLLAPF